MLSQESEQKKGSVLSACKLMRAFWEKKIRRGINDPVKHRTGQLGL